VCDKNFKTQKLTAGLKYHEVKERTNEQSRFENRQGVHEISQLGEEQSMVGTGVFSLGYKIEGVMKDEMRVLMILNGRS